MSAESTTKILRTRGSVNMIFGLYIWNMVFLLVLLAFGVATLLYMLVGLANKYIFAEPEAPEEHRYAAVISARNEEGVIGGLI